MNIGAAAKRTGLPAKTLRYYEDIGLIHPTRDSNGYRAFSETDCHKLAFIGRARSFGFSIKDCRTLLALYEDKSRASSQVKTLAQDHVERIDARLAELQEMRDTLVRLIQDCAGDQRPDCPILKDLADEDVS